MASSPSSPLVSVSEEVRRLINSDSRGEKCTFSEMSASDATFKDLGNIYFADKNYEKAIQCYSIAIAENPKNPVYLTNRALAAVKLNRFEDTMADCLKALELNPELVKGHYYLGIALCEMDKVDEGLTHIRQANKLSIAQMQGGVAETLTKWVKRKLEMMKGKEASEEMDMKAYLTRVIMEQREKKVDQIKMDALAEQTRKIKEVEENAEKGISELNALFGKAEESMKNRNVPAYLWDKIIWELLKDPVVKPSGITDEQSAVEEVMERRGHSDPTSGTPLVADELMPNLGVKDADQVSFEENEWAQE